MREWMTRPAELEVHEDFRVVQDPGQARFYFILDWLRPEIMNDDNIMIVKIEFEGEWAF